LQALTYYWLQRLHKWAVYLLAPATVWHVCESVWGETIITMYDTLSDGIYQQVLSLIK